MSLFYNNINLSVNGLNILADNINLSESSQTKAIYSLNNRNPYDNVPTNIKGSISLSYFLEPNNEPNYSVLTGMIYDTTTPISSLIGIGNINITGYLNSYSFDLLPNNLVKVGASYEIYYPFTGQLSQQLSTDSSLYDVNNSSGISHYWSCQFLSGGNTIQNNNILQMSYGANLSLTPIYGIGDTLPKQININNIQETISIMSEQQINSTYSGQILDNLMPALQTLRLKNISSSWDNNLNTSILFPMTGMVLQDSKTNITLDQEIFFSMTFTKNH
jgi:hypothetical protein